jgi:hypothetical protein
VYLAVYNIGAYIGPLIASIIIKANPINGWRKISAGLAVLKSAYADSFRVVYIIAAPFGIAAAVSCWFMARMDGTITYQVDAPMESLKAKSNNRAANEAMA